MPSCPKKSARKRLQERVKCLAKWTIFFETPCTIHVSSYCEIWNYVCCKIYIDNGFKWISTVLGLYHEQSRKDRDDYIIVNNNNIVPGKESQFRKEVKGGLTADVSYNLQSIMHYASYFFSKNGKPTMVTNTKVWQLTLDLVNIYQ